MKKLLQIVKHKNYFNVFICLSLFVKTEKDKQIGVKSHERLIKRTKRGEKRPIIDVCRVRTQKTVLYS